MYIREFGIPHILEICEIVHTNELVKLDAMEYEVKGCIGKWV